MPEFMQNDHLTFDTREVQLVHNILAKINARYIPSGADMLMSAISAAWRRHGRPSASYIETFGWCATFWVDGDDVHNVRCKVTPSAYGMAKYLNVLDD